MLIKLTVATREPKVKIGIKVKKLQSLGVKGKRNQGKKGKKNEGIDLTSLCNNRTLHVQKHDTYKGIKPKLHEE